MAENTKIEWCDHTFNPWVGCTKVSPACDHCYAEAWAKRTGQSALWAGDRRRTSAANWQQPRKWNRQAQRDGTRPRVFCASLADVFDNQVPDEWRADLWRLIGETPRLDWLLLTKRPQNAAKMIEAARRAVLHAGPDLAARHVTWPWPNVWLGTTVENQAEADRRIPHLLAVPAAVRFLSCEPLLGPLSLHHIPDRLGESSCHVNALTGARWYPGCGSVSSQTHPGPRLDWIITGGESGPGARPSHPDWFRSLRDQCAAADVPFFFKQWGEYHPSSQHDERDTGCTATPVALHQDGRAEYRPTEAFKRIAIERSGWAGMCRLGKTRAGRLLDGHEHNGAPGHD